MNSEKPIISFLVGAGLVFDAGLPLSVGLATKFRDHLVSQSEQSTNATDHAHLAIYRFLNGAIRFQQGLLNRDPEAPVNVEQVATAALRLRNRMESPLAPYVSGWNPRLTELEASDDKVLTSFLDAIYAKLNSWLTVSEKTKVAYLARLADFCTEAREVNIFSLNYDLCIEQAITNGGAAKLANGFSEAGTWEPLRLQQECSLRLFKLHGSLDWMDDELYGICSLQFPRHSDAEDFEGQAPPLLIFGTDNKLTGKEPFLTLIYSFSSALNISDILIVIGYSFSDDYLNEIVEQRLRSNSKLKILVVAPSAEEDVAKVKFLRGSPRVQIVKAGAKTALNDLLLLHACRDLLNETREEVPF